MEVSHSLFPHCVTDNIINVIGQLTLDTVPVTNSVIMLYQYANGISGDLLYRHQTSRTGSNGLFVLLDVPEDVLPFVARAMITVIANGQPDEVYQCDYEFYAQGVLFLDFVADRDCTRLS